MMIQRIAIIQKKSSDREKLTRLLTEAGRDVSTVEDGYELSSKIAVHYDAAIVDSGSVDVWGRGFVDDLRAQAPGVPLVISVGEDESAAYAIMLTAGAWDSLLKPYTPEAVGLLLHRLDEQKRLIEQNKYLWAELEQLQGDPDLITQDARMIEIFRQVSKVSATDASVVILGECGTETDTVARLIHRSSRSGRPFLHVNCRQSDAELMAKFTPGSSCCMSNVAGDGTIFLEHVIDLSPKMQAALLRMLDDTGNARIICASNVDPYEAIDCKVFREDVFFRLNEAQIFLPPLRERTGDIPLLAEKFMQQFGMTLPDDNLDMLSSYDWPGNVRELEAAVRLAAYRRDDYTGIDALLPRSMSKQPKRRFREL